jgi:hypothetical protein
MYTMKDMHGETIVDVREIDRISDVILGGDDLYIFIVYHKDLQHSMSFQETKENKDKLMLDHFHLRERWISMTQMEDE